MIKLHQYIFNKKSNIILSNELLESFNKLMNSTYSEDILFENLIFEGSTNKKKERMVKATTEFINALESVKNQIRIVIKSLNNIADVNIKKDYEKQYIEFGNTYNELIKKYFNDNKEIKASDLLSTHNDIALTTQQITKIINSSKELINKNFDADNNKHKGFTELDELTDKIANFDVNIQKRIEKSDEKRKAKEAAQELKEKIKKEENIKKITDEYKKLENEWETKLNNLEEWKTGTGNKLYNSELQFFTIAKYNFVTSLNNNDKNALNNFKKNKDESVKLIDEFIKKMDEQETNSNKVNSDDIKNDNNEPYYIKELIEIEKNALNDTLIKSIANTPIINKNLNDISTVYINIIKFLGQEDQNEQNKAFAESIATIKDNNAVVGLNLILLGAIALNNEKTILGINKPIIDNIKNKKYDNAFTPENNK